EAYGPKDRTAEGELKRKITESTISIEPKHRKRFEVPNRLHVMFASNNDWVVPAGEYERRFVVGNVSDVHLQDQAWFGPLYKQLRDGGYEAMLYDLLQMDLGDWHPRRIVRTAALAEQQEESLDPFDEWARAPTNWSAPRCSPERSKLPGVERVRHENHQERSLR